MPRFFLAIFLFAVTSLSLVSCGILRKKPQEEAPPPPEIRDRRIGSIELFNPEQKFVLFKLETPVVMIPGTTLLSRSKEGRIAALKISPERKGYLVSADVISGLPHQGDEVYITKATQEAIIQAAESSGATVNRQTLSATLPEGQAAPANLIPNGLGEDGLPIPGSIPTEQELQSPLPTVTLPPPDVPTELE